MDKPVDERAQIVYNSPVGPRLHVLSLHAPQIVESIKPGQFIHLKIPDKEAHILRRPFSVYDCNIKSGTLDILYQEVGSLTSFMPTLKEGSIDVMGPVGKTWGGPSRFEDEQANQGLLVGGGVGAAPLYLMARKLTEMGAPFDAVLGAQTLDALVCRQQYAALMEREPLCTTDDGSFGRAGFCTKPVEELLDQGSLHTGKPYDYVAVCGPEPLMKIVSNLALERSIYCEVSLEKRMACGIGACLSCVVETTEGKQRSCVDGPIFDAAKVVW